MPINDDDSIDLKNFIFNHITIGEENIGVVFDLCWNLRINYEETY